MTKFLEDQPGGANSIMLLPGKDATEFDMLRNAKVINKYGLEAGTIAHDGQLQKGPSERLREGSLGVRGFRRPSEHT